ncbi:MAG TPA: DUF2254 family protein [Vicinamibacteria bacterium]|nr:DUF2254 family protein [Vicinamibacteria bacterium]
MSGRDRSSWAQLRGTLLLPVLALGGASMALLFSTFVYDWYAYRPDEVRGMGPLALLVHYDVETLQNALGNLVQTVAAVLGITITVVAIVVQLAATRYTPRVTELFFRERTNLGVLGFFVVVCIQAIWVSLAVGPGFVPRASVLATVLAVTLSLLLMFPYFIYVFAFLDPEHVVGRIEAQAFAATDRPYGDAAALDRAQARMLGAIEQLADIAVSATDQQDKIISARAVESLRVLLVRYTGAKGRLREEWFALGPRLLKYPDFQAMNPEVQGDLVRGRLWVEWLVLRKYLTIYDGALEQNADMNHLIAINTRYAGEAVLAHGSPGAIALVVKFMNTYLRATLNQRQVRTAYNMLNQYRQLGEATIAAGADALAAEIAGHFRYYAQVAIGKGLGFVAETVAHDLARLCEVAHRAGSPAHDALLGALLEVDKEAENEAQEVTLRGVRKAQAQLAAFYLLVGNEASAGRIQADMELERPERLASIRNELLRVTSKEFWEVIDRGANFDYLDDERKQLVRDFFSRFPRVPPPDESLRSGRVQQASERLQDSDGRRRG